MDRLVEATISAITTPLYVDDPKLHQLLAPHLQQAEFAAAIAILEARGFPKVSPLFRGRYWRACVQWLDVDNGLLLVSRPSAEAEAPSRPLHAAPGQIYFFLLGDHIKIGFTTDWRQRHRNLQTAAAEHLVIAAVIAGERKREGELHERFAHLRATGEWFRAEPELRDFISQIPSEERIR